jgi:hypothetical protein
MQATDRYISNSDVVVMASAHINVVGFLHVNNVNDFDILLCHTFKNQVLVTRLFETNDINFLDFSLVVFHFKLVRKLYLAQLALKRLPAVGADVVVLAERSFVG